MQISPVCVLQIRSISYLVLCRERLEAVVALGLENIGGVCVVLELKHSGVDSHGCCHGFAASLSSM